MGMIYAEIQLTNCDDLALSRRQLLDSSKVRSMQVKANVDSGAYMLCLNEQVAAQLDLPVVNRQVAELADGTSRELNVVGPVEIRFANRVTNCNAMVLPGESEILLGAIPIEDLDVIIHPREQMLVVNPAHPFVPSKPVR